MSYFVNFDIQNVNRSVCLHNGLVQTLLLTGFEAKNDNYNESQTLMTSISSKVQPQSRVRGN